MSYIAGQIITDDDYNIFTTGGASGAANHAVANVNTIWGSGDGADKGWGQAGNLAAVSAGSTITATQWTNLLNRVSTIASHQGTGITGIANPTGGDTIAAYTALQSNVTNVFNNRLDCAALQSNITLTTDRTTSWKTSVTVTQTVTFASEANLREFFNAGGRIAIDSSRFGGTAHAKNTGWTNLLTATGQVYNTSDASAKTIAGTTMNGTHKAGGSGTPTILRADIGYHQLTGTNINIFRQYDTSTNYTANYVTISAKQSTNVLTIRTIYTDAAADEAFNPGLDTVDGTLRTILYVQQPAVTHISNSWGTPVLAGGQTGA